VGICCSVWFLHWCIYWLIYCTSICLTPSITLPYPFPPTHTVQEFSMCFVVSCSYTNAMYFNIILFLSFSSFPPSLVFSNSPNWKHVLYIFICNNACICIYIFLPYMREMWTLSFWTWLTLLKMMSSIPSIYLLMTKNHSSLAWIISHCICIPHFLGPLISCRASGLFIYFGYCE
jgi:hypothetical protein